MDTTREMTITGQKVVTVATGETITETEKVDSRGVEGRQGAEIEEVFYFYPLP